jgi:hypothetical protein
VRESTFSALGIIATEQAALLKNPEFMALMVTRSPRQWEHLAASEQRVNIITSRRLAILWCLQLNIVLDEKKPAPIKKAAPQRVFIQKARRVGSALAQTQPQAKAKPVAKLGRNEQLQRMLKSKRPAERTNSKNQLAAMAAETARIADKTEQARTFLQRKGFVIVRIGDAESDQFRVDRTLIAR